MTQGQQSNNLMEEYDLSILDELNRKEFSLKEALKDILFYLLPLFSFVLFLGILFFAVIPNITGINTKLNNIDSLKAEEKVLSERINKIKALEVDARNNQEIINRINLIVPTGLTEVVKFGERIKIAMTANNLSNKEIRSGESILVDQIQSSSLNVATNEIIVENENILTMSEIPSKFDIKGGYEDIRNFYKLLYTGNDFFVVDKMSLDKRFDDTWEGDISLVKYQFSQSKIFDPKIAYGSISEDIEINQIVMDFLQSKFINNVFENKTQL